MTNPNRLTRYCACGATLVLLSSKDAEPRDAMTVIEAFLDIHRDRPGHGPGSQVSAALARDVADAKRGQPRGVRP